MIIKTNTGKAVTIIEDALIIRDEESEKIFDDLRFDKEMTEEQEKELESALAIFDEIFGLKRKEN